MVKVLVFHKVNNSFWFDRFVCYLRSKYSFITTDILYEFYQGHINLKNSCHITIDDGEKLFYDVIYPVLKKYNIPASIFVSPKICIENSNYWFQEIESFNEIELKKIIADMTGIPFHSLLKYNNYSILKTRSINQIQEILRIYHKIKNSPKSVPQNMTVGNLKTVDNSRLITIGAHTMNHPILKNEDDETSKFEIDESINELSNLLNHEIKSFSYPNGIPGLDFSEREERYLKWHGIQLAFTTASKRISVNDNPMCISRIGVSSSERIRFFRIKLCLGSNLGGLKRLKPNGEYRERKELIQVFSKERMPIQT